MNQFRNFCKKSSPKALKLSQNYLFDAVLYSSNISNDHIICCKYSFICANLIHNSHEI